MIFQMEPEMQEDPGLEGGDPESGASHFQSGRPHSRQSVDREWLDWWQFNVLYEMIRRVSSAQPNYTHVSAATFGSSGHRALASFSLAACLSRR
jgi:hypothetical protein